MQVGGGEFGAEGENFSEAATQRAPRPSLQREQTVLPVPMQEGTSAPGAASDASSVSEVTGTEFADPTSLLESVDPLAAHMDALRRQLDGNFRDLTNHSDNPNLEKYVESEESESTGDGAETRNESEDPRDFYARVMAQQRAMEGEGEEGVDEATANLLSSVPPVTSEQAAMLAAQYASMDTAAGSALAPDDEHFDAAPPKPEQQIWVKDTPDKTPVRDEAESDDEDVALLKQMAALAIERSPATDALDHANNNLTEAVDSIARGDVMQAERVADDGSIVEENDIPHLSSIVDDEVAGIAGTMLTADKILCAADVSLGSTTETENDVEDPVEVLLSIAAEIAAEIERPTFEGEALEDAVKELTSMGVPSSSMGGGAGLDEIVLSDSTTQQAPVLESQDPSASNKMQLD